jgi:uncharacterized protein affecting Mg2+/Co2+ transport
MTIATILVIASIFMGSAQRLDNMNCGQPPSPLAVGFDGWCRDYRNEIMRAITAYPRTDYYFAADGNDANDGLSAIAPKQTVGEMNTVLAAGANRVLLNRSDTWTTDDQILLGVDGNAVGAYGVGNNPVLQQDSDLVAAGAAWSVSAGDMYVTDVALTMTTFGRVIKENDRHADPLIRAASTLACTNQTGSYFYDTSSKLLYINLGGASPTGTAWRLFPVRQNTATDNGILVQADMTLVEDVDLWGYGLSGTTSTTNQTYPIKFEASSDNDLFVASNVGAFLFNLHAISSYSHAGGVMHVEACRTGWSESITNPATHLNFYNDTAGSLQASAFWNTAMYGSLGTTRVGTHIYGHSNVATTRIALALCYDNEIWEGTYGVLKSAQFPHNAGAFPGDADALNDRRDLIVNTTRIVEAADAISEMPIHNVHVNCTYKVHIQGGGAGGDALEGSGTGVKSYWHINSLFDVTNVTQDDGWWGIFHNPALNLRRHWMYGSTYIVRGECSATAGRYVRIDRKGTHANSQYWVEDCIFAYVGSSAAQLALGDNDSRMNHMLVYNFSAGDYGNVSEAIVATTQPEDRPPKPGDQWYMTGAAPTVLYDVRNRPRSTTASSLGRYEPALQSSSRTSRWCGLSGDRRRNMVGR